MEHYNHALEVLGAFLQNDFVFYTTAGAILGGVIIAEILRHKHDRKQAKKHEHR